MYIIIIVHNFTYVYLKQYNQFTNVKMLYVHVDEDVNTKLANGPLGLTTTVHLKLYLSMLKNHKCKGLSL